MYGLELVIKKVKVPGDRESLIATLSSFGELDNDFNGTNGKDFLWEEAEKEGFDCNKDYLVNHISLMPATATDEKIIYEYFDYWLGSYRLRNIQVITDDNGNAECIAMAYVMED